MRASIFAVIGVGLAMLLVGCGKEGGEDRKVVVYTSVDQNHAEPIFRAFEASTGIKVKSLYDVEAAKTSGLVNRLIAEAKLPRADLFWSGEPLQTYKLREKGILASYRPKPSNVARQQDTGGFVTEFGGRARVLMVNTDKLPKNKWPGSLDDFITDARSGAAMAMAYPLFGTSATHAAALYSERGSDKARSFYAQAVKKGVRIVDGNSVVRDLVARGEVDFGLTDTDDACGARERAAPVAVVFPDQGEGAMGTLVIPNTVALIAGGPDPTEAKAFMDYLLSDSVTDTLVKAGWFHVNGSRVMALDGCGLPPGIRRMNVDTPKLLLLMDQAMRELKEVIVR